MDNTDTLSRRGHPPSHWFDTIDQKPSNNSFTAKGLRNAPGENNCFLNSAVQVFWHLDVFRRSYRRLTGHLCMGNSCIFCALKVIFTQFQYSDQSSLAPEALRKALAETFINQQRFQLGHMDDACECFENILRRIHFHIANAYTEDACQATHCLSHQKFAMTVFDQIVCSCGASSDPLTFNELVHYISTTALITQCRSMQETGDFLHPDKFGLLLRNAGSSSDIRNCPNTCGKRVQIRRTLLNCPDVVSIGLVWDSERPSTDLINEVCRSIGTTIMLQDVFHSVMVKGVKDVTKLPKLQLSAIVCYYGKHYSTFVFHTKLNVWVYFDDATVREIGPNWEHVVEKCCRGHYQPLLLLYTNPNANPITTETAPKKRVMAPGFSTPAKVPTEKDSRKNDSLEGHQRPSDLKRSVTPNLPDRSSAPQTNYRSVTPQTTELLNSPDADASSDSGKSEHRRQPSFLIAITGKNAKANNKSEYAVPVNNMSIKQRLPGGQNMADHSARKRPQDLPLGQQSAKQEGSDGYYTLSNNDQYRRPSISSPDHNKVPLSQNMHRVSEMQRKESFKRGKDKVGADVIRYVNPRSSSSSSDSDSLGCGESQVPPKLPVKHFRTHSVSYDESIQNRSADNIDIRQHVVMKPKPCAGHVYENIDSLNHTPVQSGLATLPRNKKGKQMQSQQYSSTNDQVDGRQSISHSRESSTHTLTEESHSRQTSVASQQSEHSTQVMQKQSSQDGKPKKPPIGSKPPKPAKPEKRSEPMANRKKTPSGNPQNAPALSEKSSPNSENYINRKMVESVLNYQSQKLTRQGSNLSCASQSSNTSFDSDTSSVKSQKDGIGLEIPFDTLSLESHRDSGYGSSDRNSSSSTGSTTLDPFSQYFISKSMIPPKNINMQAADNMRKFINPEYSGQSYNQSYIVNSQHSVHQKNVQDKSEKSLYPGQEGFDSKFTGCKVEQYQDNGQRHPPRTSDHMERKQLYDPAIVKSHGTTAYQVKYQEGKVGPSPTHTKSGDVANDEFSKLCQKSEDLMDQCMLVETSENASMALNYCNAAIDCLKQAMKITSISQSRFVMAQKMHNACFLKARSLQKRLVTRQESTSSTTSSDSARSSPSISVSSSEGSFQNQSYHAFGECCVQRTCNQSQRLQGTHSVHSSIHSRSSSRDSIDSVIENKNYRKDQRTTSANCEKSNQNSDSANSGDQLTQNIDIYATLPRKGRKNSSNTILSSSQESDSYNRNWSSGSAHHGRTPSSGSLTPTPMDNRESDFSNEDVDRPHYQLQNPTQEQVRSNRAEIRQLQHNNPYHSRDHYPHLSGSQQNEVCKYSVAPQQSTRAHPVPPPKPVKPVVDPSKLQQVKAESSDLSSSRWSSTLPTASSHKPSKMTTKQTSVSRHASFTSSQRDGAQRGFERSQQECLPPSLGSPNYNLTDHSNNDAHHAGKSYSPSNSTNHPVQLCGRQSNEAKNSSRPMTPQMNSMGGHQSDGAMSEPEEFRPSVRDLASRFEYTDSPGSNGHHHSRSRSKEPNSGLVNRHRSKSESDFRKMDVKPKSVLTRNKKSRGHRPRKSVTFSDNIALVDSSDLFPPTSSCEDKNSGYISDEEEKYNRVGGSYSDNDDEDSADSPTEIVAGEVACSLCGKKGVQYHEQYCEKCYAYLSQFQTRR